MPKLSRNEGLKIARLLMVLSSMSPLFVLWAIRGSKRLPDAYFVPLCAMLVLVPNLALWLRKRIALNHRDRTDIVVGTADDHRDHLLVYLFAMLLPFYVVDLGTTRDLAAHGAALSFIVFLFWHLNLHYMNLIFAVFGYRVFTISSPVDGNQITGKSSLALVTRRTVVIPGERINAYRLSDTVYLEVDE